MIQKVGTVLVFCIGLSLMTGCGGNRRDIEREGQNLGGTDLAHVAESQQIEWNGKKILFTKKSDQKCFKTDIILESQQLALDSWSIVFSKDFIKKGEKIVADYTINDSQPASLHVVENSELGQLKSDQIGFTLFGTRDVFLKVGVSGVVTLSGNEKCVTIEILNNPIQPEVRYEFLKDEEIVWTKISETQMATQIGWMIFKNDNFKDLRLKLPKFFDLKVISSKVGTIYKPEAVAGNDWFGLKVESINEQTSISDKVFLFTSKMTGMDWSNTESDVTKDFEILATSKLSPNRGETRVGLWIKSDLSPSVLHDKLLSAVLINETKTWIIRIEGDVYSGRVVYGTQTTNVVRDWKIEGTADLSSACYGYLFKKCLSTFKSDFIPILNRVSQLTH